MFRQHGPAYRQAHSLPLHQHRLMQAIETCRTPALGGVVEWCDHCQYTHTYYRSCRNRHCPKCQGLARAKWLEQRKTELLPTEYFHVVFTLPEPIAAIAFYNKEAVYEILFRATAQTLLTIAADPKRLGVTLGFFCVLHSWGQNLHFHPHLHCVIPGGGLSDDEQHWIAGRRRFFLPVRVLSRLFRRLFLEALEKAHAAGKLRFFGDLQPLHDPPAFADYLAPLRRREWVVYAKPPFGGPRHVIEYLGRYTHRVAISNRRLLALENGQVSFAWKDYRDAGKDKTMTLSAEDFIRRFLQHALPSGFQRIRYYGFLANCHRARKIELCRRLLATPCSDLLPTLSACRDWLQALTARTLRHCPQCGIGILAGMPLPLLGRDPAPLRMDSS
ncbi:MAG: IS91 family transposase [Burkholderiales bacterium]|nr:IS91 family transposase [Burkholderiales bacterium]